MLTQFNCHTHQDVLASKFIGVTYRDHEIVHAAMPFGDDRYEVLEAGNDECVYFEGRLADCVAAIDEVLDEDRARAHVGECEA